jgi:hypothetical protein
MGEPERVVTAIADHRLEAVARRSYDPDFAKDAGRGWFPEDAEAHRRDAPRHCPACAAVLSVSEGGRGLTAEYWVAGDRVFVCYCGECGWTGDIVLSARVVGHEAEH